MVRKMLCLPAQYERRSFVRLFHSTKRPKHRLALGVTGSIGSGQAGNICVLFTANDAYMREYKIFAPADCIVSNTAADNDHALRQIKTVLKGEVAVSSRLRFGSNGRRRTARRQ